MWHIVTEALERASRGEERPPVAVLDLDSTLIHTGARHRAIACAFPDAQIASIAAELPAEAFGWDVRDPLRERGVPEGDLDLLLTFWTERFFHSDWLPHDQPAAGAVAFTHRLRTAGVHLVYLTGRPEPTMGAGTRRSLPQLGFPTGDGTELHMKPSPRLADDVFKRHALRTIAETGPVALTFENEPAHANAFLAAFPDAAHFLVGDVHDPRAPAPASAVHAIDDFLLLLP